MVEYKATGCELVAGWIESTLANCYDPRDPENLDSVFADLRFIAKGNPPMMEIVLDAIDIYCQDNFIGGSVRYC